jgi:hypothetical protein
MQKIEPGTLPVLRIGLGSDHGEQLQEHKFRYLSASGMWLAAENKPGI